MIEYGIESPLISHYYANWPTGSFSTNYATAASLWTSGLWNSISATVTGNITLSTTTNRFLKINQDVGAYNYAWIWPEYVVPKLNRYGCAELRFDFDGMLNNCGFGFASSINSSAYLYDYCGFNTVDNKFGLYVTDGGGRTMYNCKMSSYHVIQESSALNYMTETDRNLYSIRMKVSRGTATETIEATLWINEVCVCYLDEYYNAYFRPSKGVYPVISMGEGSGTYMQIKSITVSAG